MNEYAIALKVIKNGVANNLSSRSSRGITESNFVAVLSSVTSERDEEGAAALVESTLEIEVAKTGTTARIQSTKFEWEDLSVDSSKIMP